MIALGRGFGAGKVVKLEALDGADDGLGVAVRDGADDAQAVEGDGGSGFSALKLRMVTVLVRYKQEYKSAALLPKILGKSGWWRRGESNPCPERRQRWFLHV
jgi:hypothetical protein